MKLFLQKEVYWADLNPVQGSEQSGKRPVVIISGNTMNEHLPVCIVCPLSSKVKNFSTCAIIPKTNLSQLKTDPEVITFQIRTLSQKHLGKKIGEITDCQLQEIISKIGNLFLY